MRIFPNLFFSLRYTHAILAYVRLNLINSAYNRMSLGHRVRSRSTALPLRALQPSETGYTIDRRVWGRGWRELRGFGMGEQWKGQV
jgi:hypothetical protein